MQDEITVQCPYCGEPFTTLIDGSAGNQEYIEDCQICCQPILFDIKIDTIDNTPLITTRRDND